MAGLDHIVHCAQHFDGLRTTMSQAGFTLTPPAEHPFGTGNSLVQLDGFFLEFLHIPNPHLIPPRREGEFSFAGFNAAFMEGGREGASMLVFETADARAERDRYADAGLDTYVPFDFSRKAALPDGEEVTVGFSLAFVTHPDMPRAAFFACQQHAPEHFWKPEYQRHANTALSIGEVAMVAEEPERYAQFLRQLSGEEQAPSELAGVRIATPRGSLSVYTPARFEEAFAYSAPELDEGPVFAGYRIEVANREVALNHLDTAGIPWNKTPWGHAIGPDHAAGAVMAFSEVF
jgi:hypothetical protein